MIVASVMKSVDYTMTEAHFDIRLAGDDDDMGNDGGGGTGNDTGVITRTKPKVKKPSLYRVLLLNDDFTPMEFVVEVLARFIQMNM